MSYRVRPACSEDFAAIYEMAKLTGGGFTNLPPDRNALMTRLERSAIAFSHEEDAPRDEVFVLVLEEAKEGAFPLAARVRARVM